MTAAPKTPTTRAISKPALVLALLAVALWCLSLLFPALDLKRTTGSNPRGIEYLLTGWIGPIGGHLEWYANPLLVAGLYLLAKAKRRLALGAATAGLALMLPLLASGTILINEAGYRSPIQAYLLGYWLWFASGIALVLATATALVWLPEGEA